MRLIVDGADGNPQKRYEYRHANGGVREHASQLGGDVALKVPFVKTDTTNRRPVRLSVITSGFYFGWGRTSAYGDASGRLADALGHQSEIGILNIIGVGLVTRGGFGASLGFGYNSRHYNLHNGACFAKDADGNLAIADIDPSWSKAKSSMWVGSLQFPLMLEQRLYRDLKIGVGVVMDLNLWAHATVKYRSGDHEFTDKIRNIHQRKVTFSPMAVLNYDMIGVYFRYYPQKVLKGNQGPQFNNWTMGVMLFF